MDQHIGSDTAISATLEDWAAALATLAICAAIAWLLLGLTLPGAPS